MGILVSNSVPNLPFQRWPNSPKIKSKLSATLSSCSTALARAKSSGKSVPPLRDASDTTQPTPTSNFSSEVVTKRKCRPRTNGDRDDHLGRLSAHPLDHLSGSGPGQLRGLLRRSQGLRQGRQWKR